MAWVWTLIADLLVHCHRIWALFWVILQEDLLTAYSCFLMSFVLFKVLSFLRFLKLSWHLVPFILKQWLHKVDLWLRCEPLLRPTKIAEMSSLLGSCSLLLIIYTRFWCRSIWQDPLVIGHHFHVMALWCCLVLLCFCKFLDVTNLPPDFFNVYWAITAHSDIVLGWFHSDHGLWSLTGLASFLWSLWYS